jgi:calcium-dependent protein kinase
MSQLFSALEYLHSLQILHGSINFDNVLVTSGKKEPLQIKLIDHGLGFQDKEPQPALKKVDSSCCELIGFVAPEVKQGKLFTKNSDMWSAGYVMYKLLCS